MKGRVRKDEGVRQKEGNEMEGKGMGGEGRGGMGM